MREQERQFNTVNEIVQRHRENAKNKPLAWNYTLGAAKMEIDLLVTQIK